MTEVKPAMSTLRRRMIDDMTLRNLSPAKQRSYLHGVTKFSRHFGGAPDRLGLEDVRSFVPGDVPGRYPSPSAAPPKRQKGACVRLSKNLWLKATHQRLGRRALVSNTKRML